MSLFLRATCNPTPETPELQVTSYRRLVRVASIKGPAACVRQQVRRELLL